MPSMKDQLKEVRERLNPNGGLIVAREAGDQLFVGEGDDEIVITVLPSNNRNRARLHVRAPKHVKIDRGENRRR